MCCARSACTLKQCKEKQKQQHELQPYKIIQSIMYPLVTSFVLYMQAITFSAKLNPRSSQDLCKWILFNTSLLLTLSIKFRITLNHVLNCYIKASSCLVYCACVRNRCIYSRVKCNWSLFSQMGLYYQWCSQRVRILANTMHYCENACRRPAYLFHTFKRTWFTWRHAMNKVHHNDI